MSRSAKNRHELRGAAWRRTAVRVREVAAALCHVLRKMGLPRHEALPLALAHMCLRVLQLQLLLVLLLVLMLVRRRRRRVRCGHCLRAICVCVAAMLPGARLHCARTCCDARSAPQTLSLSSACSLARVGDCRGICAAESESLRNGLR